MTNDEFQRLAALYGFAPSRALREPVDAAVAAEREACANVCESVDEGDIRYRYDYRRGALDCAAAIREMGSKE